MLRKFSNKRTNVVLDGCLVSDLTFSVAAHILVQIKVDTVQTLMKYNDTSANE